MCNKNIEMWDIYDPSGKLTKRTCHRGDNLKLNEYHLVVSIWIINTKNEYLIQRRTRPLHGHYNVWSCTAGSAISGEDSLDAALRETKEEMGLTFEIGDLNFKDRFFEDDYIMDTFETYWNGSISDVKFDRVEVSDVRWVGRDQLQTLIKNGEFYSHGSKYYKLLQN